MSPHYRKLLCLLLVTAILVATPGCVATGKTAYGYFNWAGTTFTENPVSMVPFTIGLVVFFIAGLPLCLFSWPASLIAYPKAEKSADPEPYYACCAAPSFFLGTTGGILLGGIFYPFGIPFTPGNAEKDAWEKEPAPEGPLPPPPGGSSPPGEEKK
jgi:hypothetical protein